MKEIKSMRRLFSKHLDLVSWIFSIVWNLLGLWEAYYLNQATGAQIPIFDLVLRPALWLVALATVPVVVLLFPHSDMTWVMANVADSGFHWIDIIILPFNLYLVYFIFKKCMIGWYGEEVLKK